MNNFYQEQTGCFQNSCNCISHSKKITDCGPAPFVVNIEEATKANNTFRTAIWTGEHLQVTLMCIPVRRKYRARSSSKHRPIP